MKRAFALAVLIIIASAATFASVFADSSVADAWRAWRYSRAIEVPVDAANPSAAARIEIPFDLYRHSEHDLSDLRIIDENGAETPFLFYGPQFQPPTENRAATLREQSFLPNEYTQLVVDLGPTTVFHNGVEIRTSDTNFINWVEIAVSDDAQTWRIVKDRAPISSFVRENIAGSRLVRYPDTNARYIRERIFEPAHRFPVSSASVLFVQEPKETPQETLPIALQLDSNASSNAAKTSTRWTVDLGQNNVPVDGVRFTTTQPQFFRVMRLQSSDDNENWVEYCDGEIYRYKQAEKQTESLQLTTPFVYWKPRYWRIEILNANDAPLTGVTATLLATPRVLLFYPQTGHTYRIIYGNTSAKQPTYDLARTFDPHTWPQAMPATLASEAATANFVDTRPFTERHPYVLWIAFLFAVAALGYAALRALKSPDGQNA
ncbi:MAG TPA: DUF3999 family protein [Candidatus Acidoferrum sp.]